MKDNYLYAGIAFGVYLAIALFFVFNQRKHKRALCGSPTITGIQKLINEYFFSTSYKVDWETLEVSNSTGVCEHLKVEERKGRYYFNIA